MKTIAFLLLTGGLAVAVAQPEKQLVNLDRNGVAIQGYDPVAYFTLNQAVKGKETFQLAYRGAIYYFATEGNRSRFQENPKKYAPAFGGYCAWAVSQNKLAKIDPEAFQIVDGRLLLQYSKRIRDRFNRDTQGNLKKADANWPALVEKEGK